MVHEALAKFDRIYDLQEDGRVFETPEDLWSEWLRYAAPLFRATVLLKREAIAVEDTRLRTISCAMLVRYYPFISFRFVYPVACVSCQQTAAESS